MDGFPEFSPAELELLSRLFDGDVGDDERAAHAELFTSPEALSYLETLARIAAAIAAVPTTPVRLLHASRPQVRRPVRTPAARAGRRLISAVAAVTLVLFTANVLLAHRTGPTTTAPDAARDTTFVNESAGAFDVVAPAERLSTSAAETAAALPDPATQTVPFLGLFSGPANVPRPGGPLLVAGRCGLVHGWAVVQGAVVVVRADGVLLAPGCLRPR